MLLSLEDATPALTLSVVFVLLTIGGWRRRQRLVQWSQIWEHALGTSQDSLQPGGGEARELLDEYSDLLHESVDPVVGLSRCNELVHELNGLVRAGAPYSRLGWRVCAAASLAAITVTWREPTMAIALVFIGTMYSSVSALIGRSADFYERRIFALWKPLIATLRSSFNLTGSAH